MINSQWKCGKVMGMRIIDWIRIDSELHSISLVINYTITVCLTLRNHNESSVNVRASTRLSWLKGNYSRAGWTTVKYSQFIAPLFHSSIWKLKTTRRGNVSFITQFFCSLRFRKIAEHKKLFEWVTETSTQLPQHKHFFCVLRTLSSQHHGVTLTRKMRGWAHTTFKRLLCMQFPPYEGWKWEILSPLSSPADCKRNNNNSIEWWNLNVVRNIRLPYKAEGFRIFSSFSSFSNRFQPIRRNVSVDIAHWTRGEKRTEAMRIPHFDGVSRHKRTHIKFRHHRILCIVN